MPDLLTSVPLQPGMAQRGVPLVDLVEGRSATILDAPHQDGQHPIGQVVDHHTIETAYRVVWRQPAELHLDLTEPLGRAVGLAWLQDQDAGADLAGAGLTARDALRLLDLAMRWRPMTAADVDRFARLILAVGREA